MATRIKMTGMIVTITSIFIMFILSMTPICISENIERFSNEGSTTSIKYDLKLDQYSDIVMDATGYFTIPTHRGEIKSANLNIECSADSQGNYLKNPKLDIGLDGDYEWMFSGAGYGDAGHQTTFHTGGTKRTIVTANRGGQHYNNRSCILLPKNAVITNNNDAVMKIKGGSGQYDQDLVVSVYYFRGQLYYTESNRDGTFKSVTSYVNLYTGPSYGYYMGIGLGDFDGDNDLDIVYGELTRSPLQVAFYVIENKGLSPHPWGNSPTKTIIDSWPVTGYSYIYDFAVEDFNDDGFLDFITSSGGTLYLCEGEGNLHFKPLRPLGVSYPGTAYGKDAADFNGDGYIDLVCGGSSSGSVYYFQNKGDGTFESPKGVPLGKGSFQYATTAGDFNDDGNVDILSRGYSSSSPYYMRLMAGNGDGTFQPGIDTNLRLSYYYGPRGGDSYDFNYDGYMDAILEDYYYLEYSKGLGNGNFGTTSSLGYTSYIYTLAAPPRMPLGGCENLTLNIGDDGGTPEKIFPNEFNSEETYYFGNDLKALITNPNNNLEVITDDYGNEMYKIPLRFDSDTIGSVMLHSLDIKYKYVAKVDKLPGDRYNLTTDFNDMLPTNNNITKEMNVYFGIYSETPGRVTLSNLEIEYNGAPKTTPVDDTITVDEDTDTTTIDLTDYFTDDYDAPEDMTFGIESNSDLEHILLTVTDEHLLRVNSTLVKDWNGVATASVWCKDSEGIKTVSNEFEIKVKPVNDPPVPNKYIPNVNLREYETVTPIDLDDPVKEYFTDIDSEVLYYRAALIDVEEYGELLTLSIDPESNILQVTSISGYGQNIGVKIYCSDDQGLLTLSASELELEEVYQVIVVNVTSSTATFPPQWLPFTLEPIPEDEPQVKMVRLYDYVTDPDDKLTNLTFSISALSQSGYLDVAIDDDGWLSVDPKHDFDKTAKVTLVVKDDEHNQDTTTVTIEIIPSNDLPVVKIVEPQNGARVSGILDIIGSAYDAEGELEKVEIKIGNAIDWQTVEGLSYWTHSLDVNNYIQTNPGINTITIKARAEDKTGNRGLQDNVTYYIRKPKSDSDGDGWNDNVDRFKYNPSEWQDSDDDGWGDNSDKFIKDSTQWNDTDGDGYGDNRDGNTPDLFPYDPTQWSDLDRDGHGDNAWGNSGDHYPNDPLSWEKAGEEVNKGPETKGEDEIYLLSLIGLAIVILLTIMVLGNYMMNRKRNK